jgi:CheY-like chemotaxis protein
MIEKPSVLIIGNDRFAIEETLRLASNPNINIRHAKEAQVSLALFDSFKPQLILLAFSHNRDAIVGYGRLLLNARNALESPHLCVLMTDGKHAEEASRYCHLNVVDDYVILKPMFDTHRIGVCIYLLLRLFEQVDFHKLMRQRCLNLVQSIGGISELLDLQHLDLQRQKPESITNPLVSDILNVNWATLELCSQSPWSPIPKQPESNLNQADVQSSADLHEPASRLLIMVVEDEEVNQNMMTLVLKKEGYQVVLARDGEEALEQLNIVNPDMVLMDIRMPKLNGLEVTKRMQQDPRLRSIPIVMLSAHTEQPVVRECLKSGAVDYLIKPAQRKELLDRVERFARPHREKLSQAG